jgi:hypothetical protein
MGGDQLPWHFQAVFDLFVKHGIIVFEPLQIWHIPEFKQEFVKQIGREPKSDDKLTTWYNIMVIYKNLKRRMKFILFHFYKIFH